ncbi:MAG: DNA recombination protein RmuC [Desulfuromonadia bacterium]
MTITILTPILSLVTIAILLIILLRPRRDPLLQTRIDSLERWLERLERTIREESLAGRAEQSQLAQMAREESDRWMQSLSEHLSRRLSEMGTTQKDQLDSFSRQLAHLTHLNETKLEALRESVESRLTLIREETGKQLDQMRATVDEKLHATLEQRLGESFRLVSERLELVHKGLGEMHHLAQGVGDLRKVITNVKTRGTFGEVQLGNLLEQILSPGQYARNVATRPGSNERVEFAIRLPGRGDDPQSVVWLPIDAKFPLEDYIRLVDALEGGETEQAAELSRALERRIRQMAADIRTKYLEPPATTDFGLLYLPTEGLYAEILRRTGLVEELQREKIVVSGPTTLAAFLNSLQLGFQTLAIEKRSSEVWKLLGAVKTEFVRFGDILDKTRKKLSEAQNSLDAASVRSRAIERKLRSVDQSEEPLSLTDEDQSGA